MVFLTHANQLSKSLIAMCLVLIAGLLFGQTSLAQTKGLIVKPATGAGALVLDPDGDGYVSNLTSGVQLGFNADDETESEIPFRPIEWENGEPLADLERGPNGGFTDFSFIGTGLHPVYTYTSAAGNLMFRFRLGSIAPNSKGYSILIDTDNKFGNSGTNPDPNYQTTNPGFEVEIVLATNFGVYVYNVDGQSTTSLGSEILTYPYETNAHKAVAWSTQGGNADYFYDFYVPFADIAAYFDGTNSKPTFNANTSIRMIANTVMSPHSAIKGPISDIGGVDDSNFSGNFDNAWSYLVSGQVPTASTTTTTTPLPAVRSATPKVNSPIYASATSVSGTSTEANGTSINVYVGGSLVGSTTVTGGTWTISSLSPLSAGQVVTATATASGKSESLISTGVTVINAYTVCNTVIPVIDASNQNAKTISGTISNPTSQTITITLYIYTGSGTIGPFTTTTTGTTWTYDFCGTFGGSQFCTPCGTYYATAKIGTGCESAYSTPVCFSHNKCNTNTWTADDAYPSTSSTTANPTITTTSLTASSTTISGTSVSGGEVISLYKSSPSTPNNYFLAATTTATGTNWSFSGQSLAQGQNVLVRAQVNGQCISGNSNIVLVGAAALSPSTAPVVTSPIFNDETIVKGTSVEEAGTTITVYQNGVSIGTTTVDMYGGWVLTVASGTLISSRNITATATASGKSISLSSNSVPVSSRPTIPAVPSVTSTLYEQGTSISGTGPASTVINVYIDGSLLGTVTSDASGNWTLSGLRSDIYDLYAGGLVYATSGTIGTNESAASSTVTVLCNPGNPAIDKNITINTTTVCAGDKVEVTVKSSDKGVIYTLRNNANTTDMSPSVLGDGNDIILTSFALSASQTFKVSSKLAESGYCGATIQTETVSVTVNPLPNAALTVNANTACNGTAANIYVEYSEIGISYQLRLNATNANVGAPVNGTGENITLVTGNISATTVYNILATNISTGCATQLTQTATVQVNCPAVYTVNASKPVDTYTFGEELATVSDPETIKSATLVTVLPPGTSLNTTTGRITVSDQSKLVATTYIAEITTTDMSDFITYHYVTLKFDPAVTPLPVSFVKFSVKTDGEHVLLDWTTASEKNNKQFEIERSINGKEFIKIGQVAGKGTVNEISFYDFKDSNPIAGSNYYRLKQVDFDGSFEYSRIVSVSFEKGRHLQVYPNPAKATATVHFNSSAKQTVILHLVNMQGKKLLSAPVNAAEGTNEVSLKLDGIVPGMYLISIEGKDQQVPVKLIVE